MEFEYSLSKKDYFEAGKLYLKDALQMRSWVLILLSVLFIFTLSGDTKEWWRFLSAVIISPVIAFAILYWLPLLVSWIRLSKALANDKSGLERKKVTITDEGLLIDTESKTTSRKWESFVSAQPNDKFINLILADKKYLPIPKTAFPSESEAINFLGLVQSKIIKIRGGINFQINSAKSKPPYLIGLICIIPLIGAFVGFGLLMYGIFKYKDKWLTIIGACGIAWTVLVYSTSLYQLEYGIQSQKGFAQISQMQINKLMKDIEFYKLKYGTYPDSLEQISKEDQMAWINDPLQSLKFNKKGGKFNYQKVGDHYYLFSSGIDGIPNTKDDIYPQVAPSDSAKFGLIRK